MLRYRRYLKPIARQLRNEVTDCERILWGHLRSRQAMGVQFYRQKPLGPYIVDFYAPSIKMVIEVDGSQHREAIQREQDAERDAYLEQLALNVLRFDNNQVRFEIDGVMEVILQEVE